MRAFIDVETAATEVLAVRDRERRMWDGYAEQIESVARVFRDGAVPGPAGRPTVTLDRVYENMAIVVRETPGTIHLFSGRTLFADIKEAVDCGIRKGVEAYEDHDHRESREGRNWQNVAAREVPKR